jgi:hypothetical protein
MCSNAFDLFEKLINFRKVTNSFSRILQSAPRISTLPSGLEMAQALPSPPDIVEHPPESSPLPLEEDVISPAPSQPHLLNRPRRPSLAISTTSSQGDNHTGKSWAESVDDPWLPLILTLDGGGIRGYSSLLIIERLMAEVAIWENHFERLEQPVNPERYVLGAMNLTPCIRD